MASSNPEEGELFDRHIAIQLQGLATLKYCEETKTLREQSSSYLVATFTGDRFVLDLDSALPVDFVVRFCTIWHSLHKYASPLKLVDAINAGMKGSSFIDIKGKLQNGICMYKI